MRFLSRLASLRRNLLARRGVERDLDDELRAYLDQMIDERRSAGMDEAQARRAALLELGGLEQVKEEVRQVKTGQIFREFVQDVRYATRTLRKNPAFTLVAILALAVGIGANTAMFSVAYGLLLRPLPYGDSDRIAAVFFRYLPRDFLYGTMCIRDYEIWRENNHVFEDPSLFRHMRMDIGGREGVPEQVQGSQVTAGFFSTMGVHPLIGRTFVPGEDAAAAAPLVVLGEAIWRRHFAGDPKILGQPILVNGSVNTVIGVMPSTFHFPSNPVEVWTNLHLIPPTRYGPWFYRGVARLKPGVTLEQAQAETNRIGQIMMQRNPYYKGLILPVLSLRDALLGTSLKPALLVLTGAVGLVLLIAVVNVANLLLARATVRQREMALRLSLGAGRGRLVRQLLTESILLAGMGGIAGLAVAYGGIQFIQVWNPGNLPFLDSVRLDGGALLFMVFVSALTGILFGLVPAIQSSRADLNSTLKEGGRSGAGSRTQGRTRAVLVVAEIAVSLMLLVGAGLLLRSFVNLQRVDGGFSTAPRKILTMLISPGNVKYREDTAGLPFYDEVLRRVHNIPGIEKASVTDSLPPDRQGDADTFLIEGQTLAPGELNPIISAPNVGPEYFQALGVPLLKGRYFDEHDRKGSEPVTIVSEGFVRRFLPNREPLGMRLKLGDTWTRIVGVVGNVKYLGLTVDTDPAYYVTFAQNYGARNFLVFRTSGDAARLTEAVTKAIQGVDPGVTLAQITTLEQVMNLSVSQPRFDTMLLTLFAAIALLLAAVGIYGLIAYSVAQRTHEIGVRMALGAEQADVMRMVVRQGAGLALTGIAIGTVGSVGLTRLLKTMLFGVGATDVLTFSAAPVALLAVVLLATIIPALRATRISPVVALRYE